MKYLLTVLTLYCIGCSNNANYLIEKGKVAAQGTIDEIISYKKLSYFNKGNQKSSLIKGKIIEHDKEKFSSTIDVNGTLITTKKINDKVGSNHILKLFSKDISVATEAPKYISINNILETRINEEGTPV